MPTEDLPAYDELVLRPAVPADAAGIAAVHLAARAAAPMPPGIHPPAQVHAFLAGRIGQDEVWVAELPDAPGATGGIGGGIGGYARFTRTWLDDLYVAPACQGRGVGSALLEVVKARHPRGFSLWVFATNRPARAFYARHGLLEREHTDGSENEEHAPDVRMEWLGECVGRLT